ncbi:MAG: hypothetical protein EU540_04085 [Promethearchaeota archaeon]|nr:MAG: hypothetical protein EU540_04085 [Candidatus Lokiarchaeota archaeon]
MMKTDAISDSTEKAVKSFDNIEKTLKGLMEIARISAPTENDLYFKLTLDNIIVLYGNIIDLITNDSGIKQLKKKFHDLEISKKTPLKFLESND